MKMPQEENLATILVQPRCKYNDGKKRKQKYMDMHVLKWNILTKQSNFDFMCLCPNKYFLQLDIADNLIHLFE